MDGNFSERLDRIRANDGTVTLFAGHEPPQDYPFSTISRRIKPVTYIHSAAILAGLIVGLMAGYFFKLTAGIDLLMSTSLGALIDMALADLVFASSLGVVAFGILAFIFTLVVNFHRLRLLQFWGAYVLGIVGLNAVNTWPSILQL